MRTTILATRGGKDATLAPGALEVEVFVDGGADDAVLLGVLPESADVRILGPRRLLLTRLSGPLELMVRPARASTFGAGVRAGLQVTSGRGDEQVVLNAVLLSGAGEVVLLTLEPGPAGTVVRAEAPDLGDLGRPGGAGADAAPTLEPGAPVDASAQRQLERTVASVRRALGRASVDPAQQRRVGVVLDLSASMLVEEARAGLTTSLDVLLGFVLLCARGGEAPVWVASGAGDRAGEVLSKRGWEGLQSVVRDGAPTCGSAVAPALTKALAVADMVIVVTDDVPADLHLLRLLLADREGADVHLLVLATSAFEEGLVIAPWQDELRALVPLVEQGLLTVTSLAPAGRDRAARLADDDVLDALTRGLVGAWQRS